MTGHFRDPEERRREREEGSGTPLHPDATDPKREDPHHALNNLAADPDPTEYPDPYERRPDPRGPEPEGTSSSPRRAASPS
jgi:hypothetical protein